MLGVMAGRSALREAKAPVPLRSTGALQDTRRPHPAASIRFATASITFSKLPGATTAMVSW